MESLREAVTCPVCQEVPAEGGLLLCKASHTICEGCYSKLKKRKVCPQCQAPGSNKPRQSRLAGRVLEKYRKANSTCITEKTAGERRADELAAELKEEVTCPVCLDMPRSGYLLCANGHLTCRTCHSRLKNKSCPQCRARCSKGEQQPWQSHLATRILERLQNVECFFAKEGCPNRYETKKEAWQHQHECPHRPVPCFMGWCKDKASIYKMLDHANEKHNLKGTYLVEKESNRFSTFFRSRWLEKGGICLNHILKSKQGGRTFLCRMANCAAGANVYGTVYLLGGSDAESFSATVSLQRFVPYAERRGEKKKKRFEGVYGYTGPVNGLEALEDPAKARGLSVSLEDAKKVEEKRSEDCVGFNFEFRIRKV